MTKNLQVITIKGFSVNTIKFNFAFIFPNLQFTIQCRLVKHISLRLSGVFHLTKMGLSGENT